MRQGRQDRGVALVVVLWVSLLVAAIAGAFVVDTRTSARLTRNFVDNAEARALADGGVHLAVYELRLPDETARPRRDGRVYRRTVPGGHIEFAIEDEAGKINLNQADDALLEGLFLSAGVAPASAQTFVAAIDTIRSGGATLEQSLRASSAARGPRIADKPFVAVDALAQLPGITGDIYSALRPAITVHGESEGLYYLHAPRAALLAVPDVSREAVAIFLAERSDADTTAPLDRFLAQGQARNFWRDQESDFVTVKVLAHADNGALFARIAVLEIGGPPERAFVVHEWREGDATLLKAPNGAAQADRAGST